MKLTKILKSDIQSSNFSFSLKRYHSIGYINFYNYNQIKD